MAPTHCGVTTSPAFLTTHDARAMMKWQPTHTPPSAEMPTAILPTVPRHDAFAATCGQEADAGTLV